MIVLALGPRLELRGIGASGGLGHAERLQPQPAGGDLRQVLLLLLRAAVTQHGAHDVHLRMAGARVAAGRMDFLERRRGGTQRHAQPAVFLGDQRSEKTGLGQRRDELGGISLLFLERAPIAAWKIGTYPPDQFPDFGIGFTQRQLDWIVIGNDSVMGLQPEP